MPKKLRERSNATLADVTQPGRMVTPSDLAAVYQIGPSVTPKNPVRILPITL